MHCAGWIVGVLVLSAPVSAQNQPRCALLCAPELKIEPTWTIENLGARSKVEIDGPSKANVF
jgi:hypothetical protein